tara:strand:- start:697 stop:1017 length:321 start_codon:yes stop_codon:yes gene_type:complete
MSWEYLPGERSIMLKIGPHTIPVVKEELEDQTFGEYINFPEPIIKIHARISPQLQAMTLLHEILECVVESYGLDLSEADIRTIENALVMVVKDNPKKFQEWSKRIQ